MEDRKPELPVVVKHFNEKLPKTSPHQEIRVKLVYFKNNPKAGVLLDIRDFIRTTEYIGYTKKGVCLTLQQVKSLSSILPDIIRSMEDEAAKYEPLFKELRERNAKQVSSEQGSVSGKIEEIKIESQTDAQPDAMRSQEVGRADIDTERIEDIP